MPKTENKNPSFIDSLKLVLSFLQLFITIPFAMIGFRPKFLRIKNKKLDVLESKIIAFGYLTLLFIFLPLALWTDFNTEKKVKSHGLKIPAGVIEVFGINNSSLRYRYEYKGIKYEKVIDNVGVPKKRTGDDFYVLCDTISPENVIPYLY